MADLNLKNGVSADGTNSGGVEQYTIGHEEDKGNAEGQYSTAFGYRTQAEGTWSHAEGGACSTSANYAHAEGVMCEANNSAAHAQNQSCIANGQASHAGGFHSIANDFCSFTQGEYLITNGDHQFIVGLYNNIGEVNGETDYQVGKRLFVVGNGNRNTTVRSNAFEVMQDGHAEVQNIREDRPHSIPTIEWVKDYIDQRLLNEIEMRPAAEGLEGATGKIVILYQ